MGFTSARASESESELSEPSMYFIKGYESAVTAIITDSEDDLFFLNGKSCCQKPSIGNIACILYKPFVMDMNVPLSGISLVK